MRSSAALLFCLFVVLPLTRAKIESDRHVLILTNENFDEAIRNHKYMFVFFVDPMSLNVLHRKTSQELARAANELAEKKALLNFGKVDYTKQTKIKRRFNIRYPTLKFFKDGEPVHDHGYNRLDIMRWLKMNFATPEEISTPEELTAFKEARRAVVLGLFKNRESRAAKDFLEAAVTKDVPFGISSDDAVFAAAGAEDGQVVLYKKFDEGRNVLEKVGTVENLRKFVNVYSWPLVIDCADKSIPNIDDKLRSFEMSIRLYIDKQNAEYEKISANLRESAKQFRGTVAFMTCHSDHPNYVHMTEFLGLKESDTPRMRILRHFPPNKFKPKNETNFEPAAISAFVQAVAHGEIKPYFRSQDLPKDWDKGPVKVLVGTNFHKIALDKSKNVLVWFIYPGYSSHRELSEILNRLGAHFRHYDQVVIAKFDFRANELEHGNIWCDHSPKLYKKNTNEVVVYKGERTFWELVEFVETNSVYGEP